MKHIPLSKGKTAIVDDEWYYLLSQHKWFANGKGEDYAKGAVSVLNEFGTRYMHRIINKTPYGMFTDHINGNRLDNRSINLRSCTHKENNLNRKLSKNKTGYKGVAPNGKGFTANIQTKDRRHYLGTYKTAKEAAIAYNTKAIDLWGEFASLNKIDI